MEQSTFLKVGIEAVKEAEKVILHYFDTNIKIENKADGSPVTIADKKAEQIIRKIITSAFPDHGFIGEEYENQKNTSNYTWVIDPIDGTRNYSHGIPLFATELALFEKDQPILGISNAPLLKKLLTAEKGKGSFLNETTKLQVSTVSDVSDAYISVGSIKYFEGKYDTLIKLNKECGGMKGFGDTWSYHFVAEGKLDAILEAKVKIWDIAAISVIVEEAGGIVTDLDGNKITTTSHSILASNQFLHKKILDYIL